MVSWMSSTHPISEDKVMSYTVFDLQTAPHTCTQSERDRLLSSWYFHSMMDLVTPNSYVLSSAFSCWSFSFSFKVRSLTSSLVLRWPGDHWLEKSLWTFGHGHIV